MKFRALSSILRGKFTQKMMKVSVVLVLALVLGIIMLSRGLSLSGVGAAIDTPTNSNSGNVATVEGNVQVVTTNLESGAYAPIVLQKGIPVKWNMKAEAQNINGCNGTLTIAKYNIEKKLVPGDNIIEFTPEEDGDIPYTCWMGMIGSNIKVVSDISNVPAGGTGQIDNSNSSGKLSGRGCCGG